MQAFESIRSEPVAPYMLERGEQLEGKLRLLYAQLAAITGAQGVDVLHEMGDEAANDYLGGCLGLVHSCLQAVK